VSSAISTIGNLVITGNVASKGKIHLDGVIRGNVKRIALARRQLSTRGNVVAEEVVNSRTSGGLGEGTQEAFFDGKSARLRDGELLRQERRTQRC
jgi:hypothetical protein